jgi:glyoxylase-like metal-dependent hydrolase (beta-lactamase superfamily II)
MTRAAPSSDWQAICEDTGLWAIEKIADGFYLRTTLLILPNKKLILVSPARGLGDAAIAQLQGFGEPRFLLAPNHYHHLGLGEYAGRTPGAIVVASDVATPRLRSRVPVPIQSLSLLQAELPGYAEVLEPPGTKNGEVWLSVQTKRGRAWIVSDAFFHMPEHAPGLVGLFLRLTGTTAGLRIGSTFLWLGVRDRTTYRQWLLEKLATAPPDLLVPGHGDVLEDKRLGERLSSLVRERL